MTPAMMSILDYPYDGLLKQFGLLWGKGEFHAGALFRQVYRNGILDPAALPAFVQNPSLAHKVTETFRLNIPEPFGTSRDGDTYKFLLKMDDGLETESVVIPMKQYKSLCVSSQIGCAMGCRFCETAQMGFVRNLTAGEIVSQVMAARFRLNEDIRNVVFMGMGEPFENLDNVLAAIRILRDTRGLKVVHITVSTMGHIPGIERLTALAHEPPPEGFSDIRLAISLNAPDDAIRSSIMPHAKRWPMAELKRVLSAYPKRRRGMKVLIEYVLIPGVNDGETHAHELCSYLRGLPVEVNLIPYNPRKDSPWPRETDDAVQRFWQILKDEGQACRTRKEKGSSAMAACGQLGNRSRIRNVAP
ncbi:MAG: 23S rRNA (adenine(2503)-C(2))-methyltransferase RlmN [Spirochaetes bacterium]|nr:23S rRNA (adenine(2503)-C(2))-methyltransferase RlmN [Spirochaetota bacterium]